MWAPVVGPFAGREEAEAVVRRVEREGKGWWQASVRPVQSAEATPAEWEVIASSERFGNGKGDVEQFAARLNRKGPCRGKVRVREAGDTNPK
jgi:hypothetical protein